MELLLPLPAKVFVSTERARERAEELSGHSAVEDGASGVRVKMWPLDTRGKEEAVNAATDVMTRENATRFR